MTSRMFIIDTENLNKYDSIYNRGLTPVDCVVFAYTENSRGVHLKEIQPIIDSGCEIQFEKMEAGRPNALDFQIVTYLAMKVLEFKDYSDSVEFYIVSSDKGFESAINYLHRVHPTTKIERIN